MEQVNNYLRYPCDFNNIRSNVEMFKKLKHASFMINHTVQNFNLMYVRDMIDYANSMKIHCTLSILEGPEYLHLGVLPEKSKVKSLERLSGLHRDELLHITNYDALMSNIKQCIQVDKDAQIERFKQVVAKRDAYRKISLSDFIPELAKDLNI